LDQTEDGRLFRTAWIKGVTQHYPGTPKPGYISPWEDMPEWERHAASAVFAKTRAFILANGQPSTEQGGRFIAEAWNVQVYRHIEKPKSGYVADWEDLPEWQRKTDIDIFSAIKDVVLQEA
jgi:hypothetical protein